MWDKNKITEAKIVLCTVLLNETHLTFYGVVAAVLAFGAFSATMEIVWLHAVPLNF